MMRAKSGGIKNKKKRNNRIRVLEERIERLERIIEEYLLLQEDDMDYYDVNPYEDFVVPLRPPQNIS